MDTLPYECTEHTEETVAGYEATCTETGLTDGVISSVCEAELVAQTVIEALGHTAGEAVRENETAAGCGEAGTYDEVVYCTVCGYEISREAKTIEATGAHTPAEAVKENEVAATCTEAGSYEEVVVCVVCGTEISRETKTVEALGHTEETVAGYEATCTETGLTDGVICSVCEAELVAQTVIEALGHTAGEAVRENETAAGCGEAGTYLWLCKQGIRGHKCCDLSGEAPLKPLDRRSICGCATSFALTSMTVHPRSCPFFFSSFSGSFPSICSTFAL